MRLLSRLVDLDPFFESLEEWVLGVTVATIVAGLAASFLPPPSAALMRDVANIGIVLVLAYVVEAAWLTPHVVEGKDDQGDLGILIGFALTGFLGVVVAVLVSAHRAAGHANLLDDFGLAWSVASLFALGAMVILQPWLVHVWEGRKTGRSDPDSAA